MFTITSKKSGENNKTYSYRIIKDAIMYIELKPGQSISEIELAEALNISRTPIREVLTQLREENLIQVIPQVGTYVTKINPQLIEEAAFMRFILEREVIKLACNSFPEFHLESLKRNVAYQKMLLDHQDRQREFHRLDTEFHKLIFHGNGKEHIWDSIHRLSTHYNRIRLLSESEYGFQQAIHEHEEIIQIIEFQQVDKVESAVRKHILEPTKHWKRLLEEDSQYFEYFETKEKMTTLDFDFSQMIY